MYDMQVVACKENLIYIIYMLLSALACIYTIYITNLHVVHAHTLLLM